MMENTLCFFLTFNYVENDQDQKYHLLRMNLTKLLKSLSSIYSKSRKGIITTPAF